MFKQIRSVIIITLFSSLHAWHGMEITSHSINLAAPFGCYTQFHVQSIASQPILLTSHIISGSKLATSDILIPGSMRILQPGEQIIIDVDWAGILPGHRYHIAITTLTDQATIVRPITCITIQQQDTLWFYQHTQNKNSLNLSHDKKIELISSITLSAIVLAALGHKLYSYYQYLHQQKEKTKKEEERYQEESEQRLERDLRGIQSKYPELIDANFIENYSIQKLYDKDSTLVFNGYVSAGQWILHENKGGFLALRHKNPQLLETMQRNWARIATAERIRTEIKFRAASLHEFHNTPLKDATDFLYTVAETIPQSVLDTTELYYLADAQKLSPTITNKPAIYPAYAFAQITAHFNEYIKKKYKIDYPSVPRFTPETNI